MNDHNEAIEKVISGIRNAAVPDGLEQRVLAAVRGRGATAPRRGWSSALWPAASGVALAGAVAVVILIGARHWHGVIPAPPKHPSEDARVTNAFSATSNLIATAQPHSRHFQTGPRGVTGEPTADSLALAEMLAPSQPEPPMPLTQQERLLVRIVHAGDPQELAALDPAIQHALDDRDKAEFDRFFRPSPIIPQPVPLQPNPVQPDFEQPPTPKPVGEVQPVTNSTPNGDPR